jgi:ATP-dependent Clp protease protease subunit
MRMLRRLAAESELSPDFQPIRDGRNPLCGESAASEKKFPGQWIPGSVTGMDTPAEFSLSQRLLKQRIVVLGEEVTDESANRICGEILLLSAEDPARDIQLYINSPGGSVSAGLAVYDVMQFVPNDIVTVAMGLAASMGQVLLCAGTAGKRYALPHARIVMHQPHGGIGGTASDIKIQAEQMLYSKRILAERTAFHTGQSLERIQEDSDRDRWFTAEEAKSYGFVDQVVLTTAHVATA